MTKLLCLQLPKSITENELRKQATTMNELRLLSLRMDQNCFISRYEDEVNQPLEFAMGRVGDPEAEHFVAVDPESVHNDAISYPAQYHAFLVMLKETSSKPDVLKEYSMAAVYVRPDHRGQGLCTQLIQRAIHWATEDFQKSDMKEAVIHTTVVESNMRAQRLYSKLGFKDTLHIVQKNSAGEDVAAVNMDLQLT